MGLLLFKRVSTESEFELTLAVLKLLKLLLLLEGGLATILFGLGPGSGGGFSRTGGGDAGADGGEE